MPCHSAYCCWLRFSLMPHVVNKAAVHQRFGTFLSVAGLLPSLVLVAHLRPKPCFPRGCFPKCARTNHCLDSSRQAPLIPPQAEFDTQPHMTSLSLHFPKLCLPPCLYSFIGLYAPPAPPFMPGPSELPPTPQHSPGLSA